MADSTEILQWCDLQSTSDRKLYPIEAQTRKEVEAFENYLDETLGVAGRLQVFTEREITFVVPAPSN